MSGWFRMERGWRECDVFAMDEPFTEREAWAWLIEKAAWKSCVRRAGKGERIDVDRGQFHTSLRTLGSIWGWGKNRVSRYLDRLECHDMIGTVAGQSGLLITICNYAKYQDARDGQEAADGTVSGQSRDTQEENKTISPIPNGIGAAPDADKVFWENAKAYLAPHTKDPGKLIGRWIKDCGGDKAAVSRAISEAQVNRVVDPVSYISRLIHRQKEGNDGKVDAFWG